jgi:hypothetical protein
MDLEGMPRGTLGNADKQESQTMQKSLAVLTAGLVAAGLCLGTGLAETKHKKKATWYGTHTMTGTMTNVDHTTGMLSLNTHAGELQLHFPPDAVKEVKNGDALTVS